MPHTFCPEHMNILSKEKRQEWSENEISDALVWRGQCKQTSNKGNKMSLKIVDFDYIFHRNRNWIFSFVWLKLHLEFAVYTSFLFLMCDSFRSNVVYNSYCFVRCFFPVVPNAISRWNQTLQSLIGPSVFLSLFERIFVSNRNLLHFDL